MALFAPIPVLLLETLSPLFAPCPCPSRYLLTSLGLLKSVKNLFIYLSAYLISFLFLLSRSVLSSHDSKRSRSITLWLPRAIKYVIANQEKYKDSQIYLLIIMVNPISIISSSPNTPKLYQQPHVTDNIHGDTG